VAWDVSITPSDVIQGINALGVLLAGAAALGGVAVGKRGVAVSTRNEDALTMVQATQSQNKTDITNAIHGVTHELNNGTGDRLASKTAAHILPVIEDVRVDLKQAIPVEVAKTAEVVAAALKVDPPAYNGPERQEKDLGPPDGIEQRKKS
jgi:hypothetical protein